MTRKVISMEKVKVSYLGEKNYILSIFLYPLADYFEFKTCLAGRCLCSQNMNKYSNQPTKGYKRLLEDFKKIWLL